MITRTFGDLVQDLRQRRVVGDLPPVVVLGAGASVESGIGAMTDLFRFVNRSTFEEFCAYIEPLTPAERYRLLAQFLQSQRPADVTPGYQALAALCAEAYFDTVLTTNLDPLLDDALAAARLWRKDYLLLVNGVVRPEWLSLLVTAQTPRVKVIKLHGDLFQRCMAWTPAEMDAFVSEVSAHLHAVLQTRDVLVVGHSLRDPRIRELIEKAGGTVWYSTPQSVPDFLTANKNVRAVVGPECAFERLFTGLAEALDVALETPLRGLPASRPPTPAPVMRGASIAPAATAPASPGAQTIDDLMASVVALEAHGQPCCTGFVLAEPRVIVTDGYSANTQQFAADPGKVTVVAADRRRFVTRVVQAIRSHPFGPFVLAVPEDLKVPGLRLNPAPVDRGLSVRIAVAAGERIGFASGTMQDPAEQRLDIAPIGQVDHLVAVECVTAPGASGAPVVDATMSVRGFIVAGATDHPPSFMYPATRWAAALGQPPLASVPAGPGDKPSRRGGRRRAR